MTFYEHLEKILSTKHCAVVKDDDGCYTIFSCWKDENGVFRHSDAWGTLEECMERLGECYMWYNKETLNELAKDENWQVIDAFDIEHEADFKVGDKVEIIDNSVSRGKIVKIKAFDRGGYQLEDSGGRCLWDFSKHKISYPLNYQSEVEEMTLEEVCEELGRYIKIKK